MNTKAGKENSEQVPGTQAFRGKTRRFNNEDREGLVSFVQGLQGRALDVKYRKNFRKREQSTLSKGVRKSSKISDNGH